MITINIYRESNITNIVGSLVVKRRDYSNVLEGIVKAGYSITLKTLILGYQLLLAYSS